MNTTAPSGGIVLLGAVLRVNGVCRHVRLSSTWPALSSHSAGLVTTVAFTMTAVRKETP